VVREDVIALGTVFRGQGVRFSTLLVLASGFNRWLAFRSQNITTKTIPLGIVEDG
jgi:hypothetical protein